MKRVTKQIRINVDWTPYLRRAAAYYGMTQSKVLDLTCKEFFQRYNFFAEPISDFSRKRIRKKTANPILLDKSD